MESKKAWIIGAAVSVAAITGVAAAPLVANAQNSATPKSAPAAPATTAPAAGSSAQPKTGTQRQSRPQPQPQQNDESGSQPSMPSQGQGQPGGPPSGSGQGQGAQQRPKLVTAEALAAQLGMSADEVTAAEDAAHQAVQPDQSQDQAAPEDMNARHEAFETAFAQNLGISLTELREASAAVAQTQLSQAVSDGKMTQEQADQIVAAIREGQRPKPPQGEQNGPPAGDQSSPSDAPQQAPSARPSK